MDYNAFLFSQLFMAILENTTEHLAYDEIHPTLVKVYLHYLATDELYCTAKSRSDYEAMEHYLKDNADSIKALLES